jgi:hypothetical protein
LFLRENISRKDTKNYRDKKESRFHGDWFIHHKTPEFGFRYTKFDFFRKITANLTLEVGMTKSGYLKLIFAE